MTLKVSEASDRERFRILPYSRIVGQAQLKLALELAFIEPAIPGVLISGERGTAKSTAVRAFSLMVYGSLPTTLPINATEDRVVGGWRIDELMRQQTVEQPGLLEEANGGILYIDEVNLLDDHIVNIILDVASTGVLVVQREGRASKPKPIDFALIGTMNPEEGGLRPQLLDRFGLMVTVSAETDEARRIQILQTLLHLDRAEASSSREGASAEEEARHKELLLRARALVREGQVDIPKEAQQHCVRVAGAFRAEGHRGELVMALAARAFVARELVGAGSEQGPEHAPRVMVEDVFEVARLAIQHRRPEALKKDRLQWGSEDEALVRNPVPRAAAP